jgi:hypothetical protein
MKDISVPPKPKEIALVEGSAKTTTDTSKKEIIANAEVPKIILSASTSNPKKISYSEPLKTTADMIKSKEIFNSAVPNPIANAPSFKSSLTAAPKTTTITQGALSGFGAGTKQNIVASKPVVAHVTPGQLIYEEALDVILKIKEVTQKKIYENKQWKDACFKAKMTVNKRVVQVTNSKQKILETVSRVMHKFSTTLIPLAADRA